MPALLAWAIVALLLDRSSGVLVGAAAAGLVLALGSALLARRYRVALVPALVGLVVALVTCSASAQQATREAGPILELAASRATATVEGAVHGDPRRLQAAPERGGTRVAVEMRLESVTSRGARSHAEVTVLLLGGEDLLELRWSERVRLTGRLTPAEPGDRVTALLVVREAERVAPAGRLARVAEHVRGRLRQAVDGLPADARGLVPALVIGDRSLTPSDLTEAMLATGMTHLSAVSGSNVSLVLAAALLFCGMLRVPRAVRPVVAGLCLVAFVVLARPDPSVLRAATMGAIGLVGMSASRRGAGLPALGAAVVVLLVADPWLARSYGFALSVLATLGLLVLARPWAEAMAARLPSWCRPLAEATAIPLAAQAACAPVVVLLQGSVTLVGVLANVVAAPFVGPATVGGVLTAVVASVHAGAGGVLAWAPGLPALAIGAVARVCAVLPFGALPWPQGPPGAFLLAGLTVLALVVGPFLVLQARRHVLVALAAAVLVLAVVWPTRSFGWPPARWEFAACDVGQADALVLATGPDHGVLVDVGEDPEAVDACLDRLGVEAIDAIVLTHYHADHVRGLPGALRGRSAAALYVTTLRDPAEQAAEVGEWAKAAGLTPQTLRTGDRLRWADVEARVRWPSRPIDEGSAANNASVTLEITSPRLHALLTGDIEREAAREIARGLRTEGTRPVDVLKVAHHGSANQDPGLVELVRPRVAVVSVGKGNDYGHPAPATLQLLARTGAVLLRTDLDGDVVVGRDGDRLVTGRRGP